MANRFKQKMKDVANDIVSKEEDKKIEGIENRGLENRDIENRSISDNYYDYKRIPIRNAKNGDKYKANFSLDEETMQKIQFMLTYGGFSLKDNSKIPTLALNLIYDLYYKFNAKGVNIFELSIEEIIKEIRSIEV